MSKKLFLTDVKTLRRQALQHMDEGTVTGRLLRDRETVLKLLKDALATEIVCVLHYRRHHFMARDLCTKSMADEFLVHASEEQEHANQIAERIVQLGGDPDFTLEGLISRSYSDYREGESISDMIKEELIVERI